MKVHEKRLLGLSLLATPEMILKALKKHNAPPYAVCFQGKQIQAKFARECKRDVEVYSAPLHGGHLTSSCDPFLLLCAHLLRWRILHKYAGNNIIISHPEPFAEIRLRSSTTHIDFVGRRELR